MSIEPKHHLKMQC